MSADLYSDLTIGLGMKNYPKMTLHLSQSAQWFQRLRKVSWWGSAGYLVGGIAIIVTSSRVQVRLWYWDWPGHWKMTFDLDPSLSILSAHQENIRINLQKCKAFGIQNTYLNMFKYSFQHWFRFIEMQQSNCVSRLYLDVCVVVVVVGWRWDDMMTSDQDVYSFWQFSPPETDCGDQLPSHRRYPRLSPFRLWSSPVPFYMCF